MIFVIKNHCPMLIVNVIFHARDSMLQVVGDKSLLKRNGQARIFGIVRWGNKSQTSRFGLTPP